MIKYYGKFGERRRKYTSAQLGAWFSTEEFLAKWGSDPMDASPAKDIGAYLSRAGRFVARKSIHRKGHFGGSSRCGLDVYHYGEATVSLRYRFHTDLSGTDIAGNLSVNMVSIGPVNDVVERLGARFPYLKENASINDISDPSG